MFQWSITFLLLGLFGKTYLEVLYCTVFVSMWQCYKYDKNILCPCCVRVRVRVRVLISSLYWEFSLLPIVTSIVRTIVDVGTVPVQGMIERHYDVCPWFNNRAIDRLTTEDTTVLVPLPCRSGHHLSPCWPTFRTTQNEGPSREHQSESRVWSSSQREMPVTMHCYRIETSNYHATLTRSLSSIRGFHVSKQETVEWISPSTVQRCNGATIRTISNRGGVEAHTVENYRFWNLFAHLCRNMILSSTL